MDEIKSFETCCRLCAQEQEATILIFSAEAEAMQLENKMNEYLLIEVNENDKLPKNICIICCSKLQMVCDFIDTARKSQDILLDKRSLLKQNVQTLSKIKNKNEQRSDNDTKLEAIEVNVDPMIVLQNSGDKGATSPPSSNEVCGPKESDDVRYLHEDVTIKLIKKGETEQLTDHKKENWLALHTNKSLTDNTDNNDSRKKFTCKVCKRSYRSDLALKSHLWIHNDNVNTMQFVCPSCGIQCDSKGGLFIHIKKHRSSNNLCQICGRVFRTPKNLAIHMANHKSAIKSYICEICGRSYNTQSNLNSHSIAHSTERPFKCHICKKSFKRNQDLKFHINQHTGAKPYKCPFCDKSFASSGNCYTHRTRMHLAWNSERGQRRVMPRENKPLLPKTPAIQQQYQCNLCNHTFWKRDNYMYHMYQHTGKKPFQCTSCSEEFVTRKGLYLHHKLKHPGSDRPLGLVSKNVLLQ